RQLARHERGIAFLYHVLVMIDIAQRVVEEIAAESFNSRPMVHNDGLMNHAFTPASAPAIEKTQLIVRVPAASSNPASKVKRASGDEVTVREVRFIRALQS